MAFGADLMARSQETRDLDHDTAGQRYGQQNSAILRHPFFTCGVAVFVQAKAWRADLRLDRIGPRYDLSDTTYEVLSIGSPTRDLSLGLSHEPVKGLLLALRGEHPLQPRQTIQDWLTGRQNHNGDAALVYGFPAQGPRWSLSVTWRW